MRGRAGRENLPGKVIIQTYNTDSYSIEFAKKQDYDLFYEKEIQMRKLMNYPPFCDIILIGLTSKVEEEIIEASNRIYMYLSKQIVLNHLDVKIFKPLPAPVDRIKNKIRWRIILKGNMSERVNKVIHMMLNGFYGAKYKNTSVIVDVNPNNMM